MALATEDSRCGEIFVSNKADKWTFFCSYCQKGTSDIGVFVCHVRLDHLGSLLDYGAQKENVTPAVEDNFPETESHHVDSFSEKDGAHQNHIDLIKEETISQNSFESAPVTVPSRIPQNKDISSLTDSNETANAFAIKNSTSPVFFSTESAEEFVSIKSDNPDREQSVFQLQPTTRKTESNSNKIDDKISEPFIKSWNNSEPELERLSLSEENQELNTKYKTHTQENCNTNSQKSNINKSSKKIISSDDDEDFRMTASSMYQSHADMTESESRSSIQTKPLLQQQQLRLSTEAELLKKNAQKLNLASKPFERSPKIAQQSITSMKDPLQQNDNTCLAKQCSTVTTRKDNDDSKTKNKKCNRKNSRKGKGEMLYKCDKCELKFLLKTQLLNHLEEIHKEAKSVVRYECKECYKQFRNRSGLKYHLERIHKFSVFRNLKKYYLITHVLVNEQTHQRTEHFMCDYCFYGKRSQEPPHNCTKCGRSPKKYKVSCDSIPKAQIKTKK